MKKLFGPKFNAVALCALLLLAALLTSGHAMTTTSFSAALPGCYAIKAAYDAGTFNHQPLDYAAVTSGQGRGQLEVNPFCASMAAAEADQSRAPMATTDGTKFQQTQSSVAVDAFRAGAAEWKVAEAYSLHAPVRASPVFPDPTPGEVYGLKKTGACKTYRSGVVKSGQPHP